MVRVGSGVLKVREAFWDRLDGSIRTLTPRLESSDSREADILIATLSPGLQPGDVISYMEMCSAIGVNLQRGMNFRLRDAESIILMSLRPGAPYADQVRGRGSGADL